MARILLSLLAAVEIVLGALGLVGAFAIASAHPAGMTTVLMPMLALSGLLLVASAAIFVRRPWSYYTHIGIILVVGGVLAVYLGPRLGVDWWLLALLAAIVVALTVAFFTPPTRRYFGL